MSNLITEAQNVAATGGKLTAEAQRQADERSAAVGMVKRMREAEEAAERQLAARRRTGGYVLTTTELGARIDRAMRAAAAMAKRRGFTVTDDIWAMGASDLTAYALSSLDRRTCPCGGPVSYAARITGPMAGMLPTLPLCIRHGSKVPTAQHVNPDALPIDDGPQVEAAEHAEGRTSVAALVTRAQGWVLNYMSAGAKADGASVSIDGDAEIAASLTESRGTWAPNADADALRAALGETLTQAEAIAVDAALTGASYREQAAALGRTEGYVKSARSKGAKRLGERLLSGEVRAAIQAAGMADLTAAERAELEATALRATLRNVASSAAGTASGTMGPRALSHGRVLTGAAAAEVLADEHSGACPLPALAKVGSNSAGHVIDRTEPAEPYSREHLATLPLGTAARKARAERNATRLRLTAPGLTGDENLPDMAAMGARENATREQRAAQYLAASNAWAARADRAEQHGHTDPIAAGHAERYARTAQRIASGQWDMGRVSMAAAPTRPRR